MPSRPAIIQVKHTYLSHLLPGDMLFFLAAGIDHGDYLGELIAQLEGGTQRITHVATLRDSPDPEARLDEVRLDIFKVAFRPGNEWIEEFRVETEYEDQFGRGFRKRHDAGIKLEATWPKCREASVDWENENMFVRRIKDLTAANVQDVLRLQGDMVGTGPFNKDGNHEDAWDYDLAEFLTFGLLHQAAAKICSRFGAEPYYTTTLLRGTSKGNYPIALTPDLKGMRDPEITPNEIYLSENTSAVRFQGLLPEFGGAR